MTKKLIVRQCLCQKLNYCVNEKYCYSCGTSLEFSKKVYRIITNHRAEDFERSMRARNARGNELWL
jgi:hypothetical protein